MLPSRFVRTIIAATLLATTATQGMAAFFPVGPERPPLPVVEPTSLPAGIAVPTKAEVIGLNGQTSVDIDASTPFNLVGPPEKGDKLPNIKVPGMKQANASLEQVLELLLAGTKIGYAIRPGMNGSNATYGQVSYDTKTDVTLEVALDELAGMLGFYYIYKNGTLQITPDKVFEVNLPEATGIGPAVVASITALGGLSPVHNTITNSVIFTATRATAPRIERSIANMFAENVQIVYELYAIQVDLSDDNKTGIAWNEFNYRDGKGKEYSFLNSVAAPTVGAVSGGFAYTGTRLTLDILLSFLKEQGTTTVISRPVLTVMSGTKATYDDNDKSTYISGVTSTRDTSGTTTQTYTSAETKSGFSVEVEGRYREGTVYTNLSYTLGTLLGMSAVTIGESMVALPSTTEKKVESKLRMVPGQPMLLAGVTMSRTEIKKNKLLIFNISEERVAHRSEVMLFIKPTVIRFNGKGG